MGYYDDCMDLMDAAYDNPELEGILHSCGAYDMIAQVHGYDDGYDDGYEQSGGRAAEADALARELGAPTAGEERQRPLDRQALQAGRCAANSNRGCPATSCQHTLIVTGLQCT
jgi:hypothetical protein